MQLDHVDVREQREHDEGLDHIVYADAGLSHPVHGVHFQSHRSVAPNISSQVQVQHPDELEALEFQYRCARINQSQAAVQHSELLAGRSLSGEWKAS